MSSHPALSDRGVALVVDRAIYPINEELFHDIFDPYGVEQMVVYPPLTSKGVSSVAAQILFHSRQGAAQARKEWNGQCLYKGCCSLTIWRSLWDVEPSTTSATAAMAASPAATPASSKPSPAASATVPVSLVVNEGDGDLTSAPMLTGISTPATTSATSASGDIDLIVETPTTCSTICLGGDTDTSLPLGGCCVGGAAFLVSDTVFDAEVPATCSTVCPHHGKGMPQQPGDCLDEAPATEGIELCNIPMVTCPLKFLVVRIIGLGIAVEFQDHNTDSRQPPSSLVIKTHAWYARYEWPSLSFYGPCLVPSVARHVFVERYLVNAVVSRTAWLLFLCPQLRQPWPPPCRAHFSGLIPESRTMDTLQVELVGLKPWTCWHLSISVITLLGFFCSIPICIAYEVMWNSLEITNNYGSWSDTLLLYSPCQISEQYCAILDNCYKWLILWGRIETRILIPQFVGDLHERSWSNKFYCKGHQLIMVVLVAMLCYIDPVAGWHDNCSSGTSIFLTRAAANGYSELIIVLFSKGLSFWNYATRSEHPRMLKKCSHYGWNSFLVGLMTDTSFLPYMINSCLMGHPDQGASELMQWEIAWLSVDSRGSILSFLAAEFFKVCYVHFQWEIAWLLLVSSCAYSVVTNSCQLFGSSDELISTPSCPVPIYCISVQSQADALNFHLSTLLYWSRPSAQPPDNCACGFLMVRPGVLLLGLLIVIAWPHFTSVQFTDSYFQERSSWTCAMLSLDVRLLQRCRSSYFWNSFEVALVIDTFLPALVNSCFNGSAIQCGSEVMQWLIAWFFDLVLQVTGVQYYPTEKYSIYGSEQFQWKIAWSNTEMYNIGNGFVQFVLEARRCYVTGGYHFEKKNADILQFSTLQAPWDPGGSPRHRLEGKPKFKEGGLSATSYYSWAGQWAVLVGLRFTLDIQMTTSTNRRNGATEKGGLEQNGGGFGRGLA